MDYEVTLAGKPMGRAQAEKQGLYYHVVCRCRLSGDVMYRLECSAGEKKTNLGILVPMDAGFGLDTRFPVSRVGEGELRFVLLPRHDEMKKRTFVPIRPEEPFRYMEQLKDAFLETREGQKGAVLPLNQEGENAARKKCEPEEPQSAAGEQPAPETPGDTPSV